MLILLLLSPSSSHGLILLRMTRLFLLNFGVLFLFLFTFDDIIVIGTSVDTSCLISKLCIHITLKDLGSLHYFLA